MSSSKRTQPGFRMRSGVYVPTFTPKEEAALGEP
jgi:hypothetical protein